MLFLVSCLRMLLGSNDSCKLNLLTESKHHPKMRGSYLKHKSFLKTSIPYYSNSCACFNNELLVVICGDVQSNPGPTHDFQSTSTSYTPNRERKKYSATEWYKLCPSTHECLKLPDHTLKLLKTLGIDKRMSKHRGYRGCRAGTRKQRKIQVMCTPRQNTPNLIRRVEPQNLVHVGIDRWNIPTLMNTNSRSLIPKLDELSVFLHEHGIDIACITETWCQSSIPDCSMTINNYHPPPPLFVTTGIIQSGAA